MKVRYLILWGLFFSFIFTSCKLDGSLESTPQVNVFFAYTTSGDTLGYSALNVLDTITVGDTLVLYTVANGIYNGLLEYDIRLSEKESSKFIWPDAEAFDTLGFSHYSHDTISGNFKMSGDYEMLAIPLRIVAKQESAEQKITFRVLSNASNDYNSASGILVTPIKAKKEDEPEEKNTLE